MKYSAKKERINGSRSRRREGKNLNSKKEQHGAQRTERGTSRAEQQGVH
jgi:hypothetical protein